MPFVALFLAMFFWGTSFSLTKEVLLFADPIFVMLVRLAVASAVFLLAAPFFPWKSIRANYRKGEWKLLFLLVLSEPCLYFLFETYALRYTSAAATGVMAGLFPLTISAGAWLFFRESSPLLFWIGCIMAVFGVAALTLVSTPVDISPNPVLGNSLMFFAVILGTCYTLIASKLAARLNAAFLTALQAWGGTIFYLILSFLPFGRVSDMQYSNALPFGHWPDNVPTDALHKMIFLGLCVSVGSYGLFAWAVSRIPATTIAILVNFIPVMALLFAVVHLKESLSLSQLVAIAVILGGVLVASLARRKTPTPVSPPDSPDNSLLPSGEQG